MIVLSQRCKNDLEDCFDALMFPKYNNRTPLSFEDAHKYIDDIVNFAYSIAFKAIHVNCFYDEHKRYGAKVARYDRNKYTQYYIIYNINEYDDIYIERIITNHITIF